jgi:hypothetical protein
VRSIKNEEFWIKLREKAHTRKSQIEERIQMMISIKKSNFTINEKLEKQSSLVKKPRESIYNLEDDFLSSTTSKNNMKRSLTLNSPESSNTVYKNTTVEKQILKRFTICESDINDKNKRLLKRPTISELDMELATKSSFPNTMPKSTQDPELIIVSESTKFFESPNNFDTLKNFNTLDKNPNYSTPKSSNTLRHTKINKIIPNSTTNNIIRSGSLSPNIPLSPSLKKKLTKCKSDYLYNLNSGVMGFGSYSPKNLKFQYNSLSKTKNKSFRNDQIKKIYKTKNQLDDYQNSLNHPYLYKIPSSKDKGISIYPLNSYPVYQALWSMI